MKIAYLGQIYPPMISGEAVVAQRLFDSIEWQMKLFLRLPVKRSDDDE